MFDPLSGSAEHRTRRGGPREREVGGGRRWPTVLLACTTALLAGGLVLSLVLAEPEVGHFRTREGREAYQAAYAEAMAALPVPSRVHDVPTSFGTVRAYEWSGAGGVPVVLLPGRSSGVPMWQANLAGFAAGRTVYALDPLGDAGLSTSTVPLRDMADQARWVEETLAGLGITRAHVVGHSFGGATAAAVAVHYPQRVATLTLLEPVFVLGYPPVSVLLWAVPASLPFLPASWRDRALAEIGGVDPADLDSEEPLAKMIAAGTAHYAAELPTPGPLSDDELRGLTMPTLVAIAGERSLAGDDAVRRAGLIPHVEARQWPGTTHSLPMQAAADLDTALARFWTHNG